MDLSQAALTVRSSSPISGPLLPHPSWTGVIQDGPTASGQSLGTERQPAGALILAWGSAVVEMVRPTSLPIDVRGPFDFSSLLPLSPGEPAPVARYRIGPGDHLEIAGGRRHPTAPVARVQADTDCEWTFVPADPPGGTPAPDPHGRHPLLGVLADRRYLHRQDLVGRLTRFPLLAGLSFDAVRFMASFLRVGRYRPGEPVFAAGEDARPTLVLAGTIHGPGGSFGPGSTLFGDDLTWDPAVVPSKASADFVARSRAITAEMPTGMAPVLAGLDARIGFTWIAPPHPWVVTVGDGIDEAWPDAQTIAFNLAAREGADLKPAAGQDPCTPVLLIDADYASLHARAPTNLLSLIDVEPTWATWTGPRKAFGSKVEAGVVGLQYTNYGSGSQVEAMVDAVDAWLQGQDIVRKILFRLPRDADVQWKPVVCRASSIQVTTDDLMDPLPRIVPPLADVLRIARPDPSARFRMVSRTPWFSLPREEEPTRQFWATGEPWIYTQE